MLYLAQGTTLHKVLIQFKGWEVVRSEKGVRSSHHDPAGRLLSSRRRFDPAVRSCGKSFLFAALPSASQKDQQ